MYDPSRLVFLSVGAHMANPKSKPHLSPLTAINTINPLLDWRPFRLSDVLGLCCVGANQLSD